MAGCPCPACSAGHTRGWLRHLLHQAEPLAGRLLTLHNLAFVARVMEDLRSGIAAGRLQEVVQALQAGASPGGL